MLGKHPAVRWSEVEKGQQVPPYEEDQGIAVIPGKSGLLVVDCDYKPIGHPKVPEGLNGLEVFAARAAGDLPRTLMVATPSGGWHFYFLNDDSEGMVDDTTGQTIGRGVDVRCGKGIIVMPDSVHKSGGRYRWISPDGSDLPDSWAGDLRSLCAPLPDWLRALMKKSAASPVWDVPALPEAEEPENTNEDGWRAIEKATRELRKTREGEGRNATLFRVCAELGERAHIGDLRIDDARRAVLGVLADPRDPWGDPGKTIATMERGLLKGQTRVRPVIVIDTDFQTCNDQAITGLVDREDVYVLGNRLMRDTGREVAGMTRPGLQEMLSHCVEWRKRDKEGGFRKAEPPEWSALGIFDRGMWRGAKEVAGFSVVNFLRPDGSVVEEDGFDSATRVIVSGDVGPLVHMSCEEAGAVLREAVCDFPFASAAHLGAWVCAVMTPLAMYAFDGPMPLFLFEASKAGAGKTRLANIASIIGTGKIPSVSTYPTAEEEMRKVLTSKAMNPKPVVLFDNVIKEVGGGVFNSLLTSEKREWSDRKLGGNSVFQGVVNTVWYVTGNQATLAPDMERRVCPCRLEPQELRPQDRGGFKHSPLLPWVQENSFLFRSAALRLLVESKKQGVVRSGWGSFEQWRDLVIGACVLGGFEDPSAGVAEMLELAGDDNSDGQAFVAAWLVMQVVHGAISSKGAFDLCRPSGLGSFGPVEGCKDLFDHMQSRFPRGWSQKELGACIRMVRGTTFSCGTMAGHKSNGIYVWRVTT